MIKLEVARDSGGHLFLRQTMSGIWRWVLGVPLLLWGLVMLYGVFSSFIITLSDEGAAGLVQALAGSIIMALFTALVLPLGWWIVFSRHWIMIDAGTRDVVQVSDWRLGHKHKRTPAKAFRAVRLAEETLDSSSTRSHRRREVYAQTIRLLAHDPARQPSIEIGALERADRERAIEVATQVAGELKLPLEVAAEGETLLSPAQEEANIEARE